MKCISLWQPWASLLAHGQKKIETRSWALPGPLPRVLAVHAAKRWNRELDEVARTEPFARCLREAGVRCPSDMPLGVVVGVVRVVEVVNTVILTGERYHAPCLGWKLLRDSPNEARFGDYAYGRYGWVCDQFFPLPEPQTCTGRQGVFDWAPPAGLVLPGWALL
jgi:hypothetical protein